jgi:hypothetical protein
VTVVVVSAVTAMALMAGEVGEVGEVPLHAILLRIHVGERMSLVLSLALHKTRCAGKRELQRVTCKV